MKQAHPSRPAELALGRHIHPILFFHPRCLYISPSNLSAGPFSYVLLFFLPPLWLSLIYITDRPPYFAERFMIILFPISLELLLLSFSPKRTRSILEIIKLFRPQVRSVPSQCLSTGQRQEALLWNIPWRKGKKKEKKKKRFLGQLPSCSPELGQNAKRALTEDEAGALSVEKENFQAAFRIICLEGKTRQSPLHHFLKDTGPGGSDSSFGQAGTETCSDSCPPNGGKGQSCRRFVLGIVLD